MSTSLPTLGFIGLGLMGQPICQRLLGAGFQLNVWNRTAAKAEGLILQGAQLKSSPAQVAESSEIIGLCVTDTDSVHELLHQKDGILQTIKPGQLIVDFSSISPEATRQFAEAVKQKGADWVDAPVSGGVPGAEQGQLAVMCGGQTTSLNRLQPVFEPLARQVVRVGDVGSGQVAKIGNQMLVSCNALVIAEVLGLAEAAGITIDQLPAAFAGGFADSLPLQILAPRMAAKDYHEPKWTLKTLIKDLQLAADLGRQEEQSTPMSSLASQIMKLHANSGYLDTDPATLIELFRKNTTLGAAR